jgi:hypothetical protein
MDKLTVHQLRRVWEKIYKSSCPMKTKKSIIAALTAPLSYKIESNTIRQEYLRDVQFKLMELKKQLNQAVNTLNRNIADKNKTYIDRNRKKVQDLKLKISEWTEKMDLTKQSVKDEIKKRHAERQEKAAGEIRKHQQKLMDIIQNKKAKENIKKEINKQKREKIAEKKEIYNSFQHFNQSQLQKLSKKDKRFKKILKTYKGLEKKLEKMPGNKGFIFRNIHFYGKLPVEKGEAVVLSEKKGGFGDTYYHEYKNEMIDGEIKSIYTLSKKDKDGHQEIIKKEVRTHIFPEYAQLTRKMKKGKKQKGKTKKQGKTKKPGKKKSKRKAKKVEDFPSLSNVHVAGPVGAWMTTSQQVYEKPTPAPKVELEKQIDYLRNELIDAYSSMDDESDYYSDDDIDSLHYQIDLLTDML